MELQNFMRNQDGKIELHKKVHKRVCVRDITVLTARSPFYVFLLLSSSIPPTSQVTHLQNGRYKDTYITMVGIPCDDIMGNRSKI